jgi:hypothetical protein
MNGSGQHILNTLAGKSGFWVTLILLALALCALPTVIAAARGVRGLIWIIVLNLLTGGVGWPAALILAVTLPGRPRPPRPAPPALAPPLPVGEYAPPPGKVISGARYGVIDSRA